MEPFFPTTSLFPLTPYDPRWRPGNRCPVDINGSFLSFESAVSLPLRGTHGPATLGRPRPNLDIGSFLSVDSGPQARQVRTVSKITVPLFPLVPVGPTTHTDAMAGSNGSISSQGRCRRPPMDPFNPFDPMVSKNPLSPSVCWRPPWVCTAWRNQMDPFYPIDLQPFATLAKNRRGDALHRSCPCGQKRSRVMLTAKTLNQTEIMDPFLPLDSQESLTPTNPPAGRPRVGSAPGRGRGVCEERMAPLYPLDLLGRRRNGAAYVRCPADAKAISASVQSSGGPSNSSHG
jgi:hypothetical protein